MTTLVASVLAALGAAWLVGLIWYAADMRAVVAEMDMHTDAIVVLTGGSVRVKTGIALLRSGRGTRLFISGVHADVDLADLTRSIDETPEDLGERITLGYAAGDTIGNAAETAAWMQANGYVSLRLVTAAYHMKRSVLEFQRVMPGVRITPHPVFPLAFKQEEWWRWPGTATLIATEYTKYLLALFRHWIVNRFL
ncbi:MAG: hypothetical protein FD149_284 [Rhodospirillaceae bacterium]|nr:MAG: hypothetical protein FD149_284 [Rhodospirillaceae bacterium]